jgi:hypothetical protein
MEEELTGKGNIVGDLSNLRKRQRDEETKEQNSEDKTKDETTPKAHRKRTWYFLVDKMERRTTQKAPPSVLQDKTVTRLHNCKTRQPKDKEVTTQ